jgi:hypothetical protein
LVELEGNKIDIISLYSSMRIKRPRIRRRHFPASQSVFANDDVLHLRVIDFGHMQRLVIDRGFVQQLLDFVRANLVAKICDEREAIENAAGHTWLLPTPFLLSCSPPTIAGMIFRPVSVSECRGRV